MSAQDVPEFDDFEYEPEYDDDGSIWSRYELNPGAEDDLVRPSPESGRAGEGDSEHLDEGGPTLYGEPAALQSPAYRRPPSRGINGNDQNGHRAGGRTVTQPALTARERSKAPADYDLVESNEFAAAYEQMEALAAAAANAKRRSGVGQLVSAMVPLGFLSVSRYQRELQPVMPVLIQGAAGLAELMVDEGVQALVSLMPAILDQTARHLASLVAQGQPATRRVAADVLAEISNSVVEQWHQSELRMQNARSTHEEDDEDGCDEC